MIFRLISKHMKIPPQLLDYLDVGQQAYLEDPEGSTWYMCKAEPLAKVYTDIGTT